MFEKSWLSASLLLTLLFVLPYSPPARAETPSVIIATYDGIINPVAAEYMGRAIAKANEKGSSAVVIQLDTPGGLDTSMRYVVKAISASRVPVVVYVAPSGARAASAGVFITLAAHIAAMAPQTNIGAAHPVGIGGGKMEKTMAEKVENDAVAYIKSIAEKRGRNAKWAEDAVRKSISSTETEALNQHVIDLVAPNLNELLIDIDGRQVETAAGLVKLKTRGAEIVKMDMGFRYRVLSLISDPNVAYILMLLGIWGLFFEFTNPGAVFPGVAGGICLILAFYAFQMLPVNYAGVLLILLAVIMFILEVKVPSHGALTVGGIISMTIGSLMLFNTSASMPFLRLSIAFVVPAVILTALFFALTIRLALKAFRRKPVTGYEGMSGEEAVAAGDIDTGGGTVLIHGEIWSAFSEAPIRKGETVIIEQRHGLKLKVRKK
jgi:membrane-bound serine protease (ClpP class)